MSGPDSQTLCQTPDDFKSRSGLGIIHLNVRSLMSKLVKVKVWVRSTDVDDCSLTVSKQII